MKASHQGREHMHTVIPILRVHVWTPAGDFHHHGDGLWVFEWVFQSETFKNGEAAAGSVVAGHIFNFDRQHWLRVLQGQWRICWTPELISSSFNQFYGCLLWFHSFWKFTGVKAWEWNCFEYKTEWELIQGQDSEIKCICFKSIGVYLIIKWREFDKVFHRYHIS